MATLFLFLCCFVWFDLRAAEDIQTDGCSLPLPSQRPLCSQTCSVQTGEEVCSCHDGYSLNTKDNTTCNIQGDAPVMFYQTGTTIYVLYMETQSHFVVKEDIGPIHKMGFGPNSTMFWIDADTGTVYSMYLNEDHEGQDVNVAIDSGMMYPNGLAIDWVSSVLYVVDTSLGHIVACSTTGENCSVIIRDLVRPLDLNIHRKHRKLIWINKGRGLDTGTVSMAEMDGYGHMVLVAGLKSPYSFVLDETIDALYWISGEDHLIHVMHMSNRDSYSIVKISESSGNGLSILGDNIYLWTELETHDESIVKISESSGNGLSILGDYIYLWMKLETHDEVQKIDKFTGQTLDGFELNDLTTANVYHTVLYSTEKTDDPCEHSTCSHLCLPQTRHSTTDGVTCRCPMYMRQVSDTQCKDLPNTPKVVVSGVAGIFELPVDFIGRSDSEVRQLTNQSADVLVYDSIGQQVIFYDSERHSIMAADVSDMRSTVKELYPHALYVEALAINEKDNILYWTTLQGNVYAGPNKKDSSPNLLYDGFQNPRGMAVDATKGVMYLCDWGKGSQILRCRLDGSLCETILEVPDGHPNMITIENGNRLYWTDSKLDTIGSLDLTTNRTTEVNITGHRNPHPFCIVTSPDRVYYTDLNTGELHYLVKSYTAVIHTLHLNVGTLYGLALILPAGSTLPDGNPVLQYGQTDDPFPTYPQGIINMPMHDSHTPSPDILHPSNWVPPGSLPHGTRTDQGEADVGLVLLAVGLVLGLILIASLGTWVCYCRRKRPNAGWMVNLVKFVKPNPDDDDDDGEQLLSTAYSDPTFKHFDDVDYPDPSRERLKYDINSNTSVRV